MFVYICQFKNESYIKKLEKMVVESEKLILAAQLSAGLVHEIRNPLTSLKGFLQLIQSGVQQKEEYYRVMIGEIDKLEKITTELLQMAKPLKKQMKMEYVKELIEDVAFMLDTQSSFKDVNLEIKCDPTIQIVCNASQIKQVLINLILNAAEAMTNKGTIYLHTYIKNQFVIMDIIDEGEGITPEVINELYEPFFTTKEQGTGLGLIITQHLLDLHQAKLEVRPNKQKGSTFTILLPLSNPSRSEEHTSELQSRGHLVCRLLLEKKKKKKYHVIRSALFQTDLSCNGVTIRDRCIGSDSAGLDQCQHITEGRMCR